MASSASDAPVGRASGAGGPSATGPGPLSPRHRAELARLNDKRTGPRSKRDGSEGTPSMGSSFSDIDGKCGALTCAVLSVAFGGT